MATELTAPTATDEDGDENPAAPDAMGTGSLVHRLEDNTLNQFLLKANLVDTTGRSYLIRSFLLYGICPSSRDDLDYLTRWMLQERQAKLLNALLANSPQLVAPISNETDAANLLAVARSGLSFSGLFLQIDVTLPRDALAALVPLLTQTVEVNSSLSAIVLFGNGFRRQGIAPLFAALAATEDLQLTTSPDELDADDLGLLADLVSKNRHLRALELNNLGSVERRDIDNPSLVTEMTRLMRQLGGQTRLERLVLKSLPQTCQALLGDFLGASHTLTLLKIGLEGQVAGPELAAGFIKNSSLETVILTANDVGDGMLPLMVAMEKDKGSVQNFSLLTESGCADSNAGKSIGKLIASNASLRTIGWRFGTERRVNLDPLFTGLEQNSCLEALVLEADLNRDKQTDSFLACCGLEDPAAVASLTEKLRRNRTLTKLVIYDAERRNVVPTLFPLFQQVVDRNLAWETFACSKGFIEGAAIGFCTSWSMPGDLGPVLADQLLNRGPHTAFGGLALLNKASYGSALAQRGLAHASLLDREFEGIEGYDQDGLEDMIKVLNGIASTSEVFSSNDLRRIAGLPLLPAALVRLMSRNPPVYLQLAGRFCQAVGITQMRSNILFGLSDLGSISDVQRAALERSFQPDQAHLAPFVEKEFDLDLIDSAEVRLFVAYDLVLTVDIDSIASWCLNYRQPGLLMALRNRLDTDLFDY